MRAGLREIRATTPVTALVLATGLDGCDVGWSGFGRHPPLVPSCQAFEPRLDACGARCPAAGVSRTFRGLPPQLAGFSAAGHRVPLTVTTLANDFDGYR